MRDAGAVAEVPDWGRSTRGSRKLFVCATAAEATALACGIVIAAARGNPFLVFGLATGRTMEPLYDQLTTAAERGEVSFAQARFFPLDELVGLSAQDPRSFASILYRQLLARIGAYPAQADLLDGARADPEREAERYETAIRLAGGVDLQLLGIGSNGHLAFNEPGESFTTRTRVVALAPSTQDGPARWLAIGRPLPRQAITQGMATILSARELVLIATGAEKATALARALLEPVSEAYPASAVRTHERVTIVCDGAAAGQLSQEVAGFEVTRMA